MYNTRHFSGNGCERLTPQIGIVPILGDVTLEFVAKGILSLRDGDLSCQPKGPAQARVAVLWWHRGKAEPGSYCLVGIVIFGRC
jgi:hypothetical protein